MVNKIKENWNAVDEKCIHCGNVTKKAIGINKQNIKKLFFTKPTLQDIIMLIMIISCILMAWSYNIEVSQYKNMVNNPEYFCTEYYNKILSGITSPPNGGSNIPNLEIQMKND